MGPFGVKGQADFHKEVNYVGVVLLGRATFRAVFQTFRQNVLEEKIVTVHKVRVQM